MTRSVVVSFPTGARARLPTLSPIEEDEAATELTRVGRMPPEVVSEIARSSEPPSSASSIAEPVRGSPEVFARIDRRRVAKLSAFFVIGAAIGATAMLALPHARAAMSDALHGSDARLAMSEPSHAPDLSSDLAVRPPAVDPALFASPIGAPLAIAAPVGASQPGTVTQASSVTHATVASSKRSAHGASSPAAATRSSVRPAKAKAPKDDDSDESVLRNARETQDQVAAQLDATL